MKQMQTERFVSRLTRNTLALILAGGRGSRLKHLTLWRAKPAVQFGGKFRIIDFPLSNCLNSGIRRIAVLTQYKAHSLIRHIQQGWGFLRAELGEFVELVPAQQRVETSWYTGTADAVFQNLDIIRGHKPEHVLILAGDHIYKMDYGPMLAYHVAKGADLTIGAIEVPLEQAKAFGVMHVNDDWQVTGFAEKPDHPQPVPGREDTALVSMGIYIFNAAVSSRAAYPRRRHFDLPPTTSVRTSFRASSTSTGQWLMPSAMTRASRPIGGTWVRWMPSGWRIWNWWA